LEKVKALFENEKALFEKGKGLFENGKALFEKVKRFSIFGCSKRLSSVPGWSRAGEILRRPSAALDDRWGMAKALRLASIRSP